MTLFVTVTFKGGKIDDLEKEKGVLYNLEKSHIVFKGGALSDFLVRAI